MKILSLNCGSSSLKYSVFDAEKNRQSASGIVERIGIDGSFINYEVLGKDKITVNHACPTHKEAIKLVIYTLLNKETGVIKIFRKFREWATGWFTAAKISSSP